MSKKAPHTAMILAAGRGSRLRPLTDTMHKALLPVGEACLLEYNIFRLRAVGIQDIVINVHHLAEQVMQHLGDGSRFGVRIHYSIEALTQLGTGGGVYHALPLLGDDPFWLISADIWSEFPLHLCTLPEHAEAHLVMVTNPSFHPAGDFGVMADGRLALMEPRYTYANMSLLHPQLFRDFSPGIFGMGDVFRHAITNGVATGELYSGPWFNVGTETELTELRQYLNHRSQTQSHNW